MTSRQTLIKRMTTELRVAVRQCPATNIQLAAEELLDNQNRPYGRQFDELCNTPAQIKRFFNELVKSVNETF